MLWSLAYVTLSESHRAGGCGGMWWEQVSETLEMGESRGSEVVHY